MSDYNWCHGPECHEQQTQSRVRGSGDNKVLRTIKIKQGRYNGYQNGIWDYFCNQHCLHGFLNKFASEVANIRPVKKPSETPIKVEVGTYDNTYPSYYEGRKFKTITLK